MIENQSIWRLFLMIQNTKNKNGETGDWRRLTKSLVTHYTHKLRKFKEIKNSKSKTLKRRKKLLNYFSKLEFTSTIRQSSL